MCKLSVQPYCKDDVVFIKTILNNRINEYMLSCHEAVIRDKMVSALAFLFTWLFCFATPLVAQVPRYSVLITELYPDPDDKQQLPYAEFIELKNVSRDTINLRGWRITDGNSTAVINTPVLLLPDSFVVITANASAGLFSSFTRTAGVASFPTLNNDGDEISLLGPSRELIHHVGYRPGWYRNTVKAAGGWTLEMIDTRQPCSEGENWKASEDPNGGTPGTINAADAVNPDTRLPDLIRTYMKDSLTLTAVFSEALDSLTASDNRKYRIEGGNMTIMSAVPVYPAFREVDLQLSGPFDIDRVYELIVKDIIDCSGNSVGIMNHAKCGRPVLPQRDDVVFTELLFNPAGPGYDYAELINRSPHIFEVNRLAFAQKDITGMFNNLSPLTTQRLLIFPGEYLVITENISWLQQHYLLKNPLAALEITKLPSMPDDRGYIALVNSQGSLIDDIGYTEKWHFALINNKEGVALEKIDYNRLSNSADNWTSAASVAGFGTPGYQNSQFRADLGARGDFTIEPAIFSPDNDGYMDVSAIGYTMPEHGYMANITVYDASGQPVRFLAKSELLGIQGKFNWNGLNEKSERLPTGVYVVLMEIFDLKGRTKKFKKAITLVRKF